MIQNNVLLDIFGLLFNRWRLLVLVLLPLIIVVGKAVPLNLLKSGCILDCVEKVVRKIYGGKNPKAQN